MPRQLPTIEQLRAALLQARAQFPDTGTRRRFGGQHRREQGDQPSRNTRGLELLRRQRPPPLTLANLFHAPAGEWQLAGEQITESRA